MEIRLFASGSSRLGLSSGGAFFMRDIGAMPTRCAPKDKAFSLTFCVSLAGEGCVVFFTAFGVKLFVFILSRSPDLLS